MRKKSGINIKRGSFITLAVFITCCFVLLNLASSFANESGYKIKFQIKGIPDTVCYLANYYGDKTYLTDTTTVEKNGKFVFEGDTLLPGGVYILAGQQNNKYLEFIVGNDQQFEVYTEVSDLLGKARFSGSTENKVFFEYINENINYHRNLQRLKNQKEEYPNSQQASDKKIDSLNSAFSEYKENLIKSNPDLFASVLIKASTEPEMPDVPVLENGREDSVFAYQYYKNHYWDNFDLTDDRLLRSPLFHKRMDRYFEQVLYQHPDTITKEADKFIDRIRPSKEVFKYVVWYLTFTYETSKIMGFDEIFVHMADNYYATGEAFWADSSVVKSITKRANELRNILIGSFAPNMILLDTAGGFTSLYHVPSEYVIVMFYETDCGHCQKEVEKLKPFTDTTNLDIQVYAVCTDTSLNDWKKFIHKNQLNWVNVNGTRSITPDYHDLYSISMTPTLFLLDKRKKIIAKRLKSDQLIPFLENYDKNKQPDL
jgi:thiol-disulfide isomerase/thioredoxin